MKSYQQFFAELKRRKVFRVMAVYGIVGFVILQVVDLAVPALLLPEWTYRLIALILLVGFPIAIVLAWAFETTPEGLQRTERAEPGEIEAIVAEPASRRWRSGLLALAGMALLFGGGWWLGQRGSADPGLSLVPADAEAADFRTIAVLPFVDRGGVAEGDPLLGGLHIAVIDKLTSLGDLRVTGLTSVGEYANTTKDEREIAAELSDVDYLLIGSVQRAGTQARINVRLFDVAANDQQSIVDWTGAVTVEDVFDVQTEVAVSVAERLEARLSPQDIARLEADLTTTDPEAITAYYRGREIWLSPTGDQTDDDAVAQLARAVEQAPEFVEAWSLLARIKSMMSRTRPGEQAPALSAVEHAERLAPESPEAIKARAWYTYYSEADFARALNLMREAERMAPSDGDVLSGIAFLQHRLGDFDEGNRTIRRAVDLDPRNPERLWSLADLLARTAKWDAADRVLNRSLAIDPENNLARRDKAHLALCRSGDPGRARRLAAEYGGLTEPGNLWVRTTLTLNDRDYDEVLRIVLADEGEDNAEAELWRPWRLVMAARAERWRGRSPDRLLDSLAAILGPDSVAPGLFRVPQAEARVLTGQEATGMALLSETVADYRSSGDQAATPSAFWLAAQAYAEFGEVEEALRLLEEAVTKPSDFWNCAAKLEHDPRFDSLRDDPRFNALVARQEAYEAAQAREAETEDWLP